MWCGGGVERSAGWPLLAVVPSGLGSRGLFGKVIDLGAAVGPLPYRICRAARIAIMADVNTTGLFLPAQIAAAAVRIATFALKSISSGASAGSVGILVVGARDMRPSAIRPDR